MTSTRSADARLIPVFIVDAFAERPFTGNPAAVCVLDGPADAAWMQHVAAEMNLSDTAFLYAEADRFRLRWFTPVTEVDLCGHATLASAHVLWESGRLPLEEIARFETRSGLLTAGRDGAMIVLDFPATPPQPADAPPGLGAALGTKAKYVGRSRFDLLVEVESASIVRALNPDVTTLAALPARGVMVTAVSGDRACDFVSRFFAPAVGIAEDPVTGSAHCCLAPFWAERLGKTDMIGHQVSARGGVVHVGVRGDRVRLGGSAVTVLRGALTV